jgi:hypothetical protein
MAVSAALDMTRQLITLATGIITVFVAIVGLLKTFITALLVQYLLIALFLELVSIVLGLLVQGAIVSALSDPKNLGVVYEGTVTRLSKLQWLFFLLGILSLALSLSGLA